LRQNIFTVGNTVDPAEGYRAFRGRDPRIEALMAKRGFTNDGGASGGEEAAPARQRMTKQ
jgi:peptidyl-dipeptidase Dcp